MDSLRSALENIKEYLKNLIAEQQESALFIALKERYEELPPIGQKIILWATASFAAIAIFWLPLSYLTDASDSAAKFDQRRQILKDLFKIQRDLASAPKVNIAPSPDSLKSQFDQEIANAGVKPEQVKEAVEIPTVTNSGVDQKGFKYRIINLTVRQAVDVAYALEHVNPGLKLLGLEMNANPAEPHYYETTFKIVSFIPKTTETAAGTGIIDAIKGKKPKPDDKGG